MNSRIRSRITAALDLVVERNSTSTAISRLDGLRRILSAVSRGEPRRGAFAMAVDRLLAGLDGDARIDALADLDTELLARLDILRDQLDEELAVAEEPARALVWDERGNARFVEGGRIEYVVVEIVGRLRGGDLESRYAAMAVLDGEVPPSGDAFAASRGNDPMILSGAPDRVSWGRLLGRRMEFDLAVELCEQDASGRVVDGQDQTR